MSERIKHNAYQQEWVNQWYWRTKDQQEIDLIEESNGQLNTFEFKWKPTAKSKQPNSFKQNYPDASFTVIHKDNIASFFTLNKSFN